ncbi:hypothetical protein VE00_10541 [Pseudogymnoascus sp. WSF 3629]|nr:hypothetical protein VE00_10541 [Pseudogymnoascus sp. WSF 3629]
MAPSLPKASKLFTRHIVAYGDDELAQYLQANGRFVDVEDYKNLIKDKDFIERLRGSSDKIDLNYVSARLEEVPTDREISHQSSPSTTPSINEEEDYRRDLEEQTHYSNKLVDAGGRPSHPRLRDRLVKHEFEGSFELCKELGQQNKLATWIEFLNYKYELYDKTAGIMSRYQPQRDAAWSKLVDSKVLQPSEIEEALDGWFLRRLEKNEIEARNDVESAGKDLANYEELAEHVSKRQRQDDAGGAHPSSISEQPNSRRQGCKRQAKDVDEEPERASKRQRQDGAGGELPGSMTKQPNSPRASGTAKTSIEAFDDIIGDLNREIYNLEEE